MPISPLEQKTPTGQTFKPSQLPNVRGTPRKAPQEADSELTNEIRARVAKAMNSETLLCPIDKFLEHYGPYNVDPNDVKECKATLLKAGILKRSKGEFQWSKYQTKPSEMAANIDLSNTERTEPKIFAHLSEIVEKIYAYAGKRRGNEYEFELVPYRYLKAAIGGTNHKMDACIVEEQTPGKLDVSTGIAPHEFKVRRDATDQIDVRQQIVGDCQHMMCDDPRRMFMFGVTIEDAFFSQWYFSRSHSVKALAFNWLTGKGIDRLIEIYLAFAFAQPADLGVDPHVRKAASPHPDDDEGQQYIYELPVQETTASLSEGTPGRRVTRRAAAADRLKTQTFKYFKTVHEINQMRPYCISGRTTRIWVVTEVKSFDDENPVEDSKHVILKDVWLEADKPTEAENMVKIFEDVEKRLTIAKEARGNDWMVHFMQHDGCFSEFDQDTKDRLQDLLTDDKYKALFLTKMHAWKGSVSKEVSRSAKFSRAGVDIFAEVKRLGEEPKANRLPTKTWTDSRTQSNPPGQLKGKPRSAKDPKMFRRYAPRQQSRFVYEEVCLELADVKTMGNFMYVINQALDALRILFCAGWVHRDISEGNILTYIENGEWKAKLSDLEFSEKLGYDQSRTDPRTGTPYYMPYEMLKAEHLLNKHRECDVEDSLAVLFELPLGSPTYERLKDINKDFCRRAGALPATSTKYIPDYDAAVRYNFQHDLESLWWLVLFYITKCVDHQPSEDYAEYIFQKTLTPSSERSECFTGNFKPSAVRFLHPKLKDSFKDFIEKLRAALYEEYVTREAFGQLNVPESYSYIHGVFAKQFGELLQHNRSGWKDVTISR